jgi:hypothetical protein
MFTVEAGNIGAAISRGVREFRKAMRGQRIGRDHHKRLSVDAGRFE